MDEEAAADKSEKMDDVDVVVEIEIWHGPLSCHVVIFEV